MSIRTYTRRKQHFMIYTIGHTSRRPNSPSTPPNCSPPCILPALQPHHHRHKQSLSVCRVSSLSRVPMPQYRRNRLSHVLPHRVALCSADTGDGVKAFSLASTRLAEDLRRQITAPVYWEPEVVDHLGTQSFDASLRLVNNQEGFTPVGYHALRHSFLRLPTHILLNIFDLDKHTVIFPDGSFLHRRNCLHSARHPR
jgi:hypothetical protein